MVAIAWTENYGVGVHILDADHRMLIDLINKFDANVAEGARHKEVSRILDA